MRMVKGMSYGDYLRSLSDKDLALELFFIHNEGHLEQYDGDADSPWDSEKSAEAWLKVPAMTEFRRVDSRAQSINRGWRETLEHFAAQELRNQTASEAKDGEN